MSKLGRGKAFGKLGDVISAMQALNSVSQLGCNGKTVFKAYSEIAAQNLQG